MNKDINNMLMSHFFGEDWQEAFADPVRKAAIDKKLKDDLEIKRLQWEDESSLTYVNEFDFAAKKEEEE